ncbi:MAG TPA: hypothetical protein VFJ97_11045 [Dermatophilaceae bacterium]|nr:hypothetical protein [Dermatophilaceae bacterium]
MSAETRRLAVVLAQHAAVPPPGIDASAYARACLTDSYEVLAGLERVQAGIVGEPGVWQDLLWPHDRGLPWPGSIRALAAELTGTADELVVIPADVPDLPGLVVAKVFRALGSADVCCAPARGPKPGCVAIGVRLPWPAWLTCDIDLNRATLDVLTPLAPRRRLVAAGPDWHRMWSAVEVSRLDPGLEGWEMTRALLSGRALVE